MASSSENPKAKAKAKPKSKPQFKCDFCEKSYVQEAIFLTHTCTQKLRYMDKDSKASRFGLMTFKKFYASNYIQREEKNIFEFVKSSYYNDFLNFGKYLCDINAVNPQAFVDHVVKSGLGIKKWTSPALYETYVRDLNKRESMDAAVERNVYLMMQWADENGEEMTDFFKKVSTNQAVLWIRAGRISPWVLYTTPAAADLVTRFSEEQLDLIKGYVDQGFWRLKFARNQQDYNVAKNVMAGLGFRDE
jgi:hypothetical protein